MKILYFDLDGTLLENTFGALKCALDGGAFERAARSVAFDKLVCVGNVVAIINFHRNMKTGVDGMQILVDLCRGAFENESWFRASVTLVGDPARRAREIDLNADWWYADDLAADYFAQEHLSELYQRHNGGRVFVPSPDTDGQLLLEWLRRIG